MWLHFFLSIFLLSTSLHSISLLLLFQRLSSPLLLYEKDGCMRWRAWFEVWRVSARYIDDRDAFLVTHNLILIPIATHECSRWQQNRIKITPRNFKESILFLTPYRSTSLPPYQSVYLSPILFTCLYTFLSVPSSTIFSMILFLRPPYLLIASFILIYRLTFLPPFTSSPLFCSLHFPALLPSLPWCRISSPHHYPYRYVALRELLVPFLGYEVLYSYPDTSSSNDSGDVAGSKAQIDSSGQWLTKWPFFLIATFVESSNGEFHLYLHLFLLPSAFKLIEYVSFSLSFAFLHTHTHVLRYRKLFTLRVFDWRSWRRLHPAEVWVITDSGSVYRRSWEGSEKKTKEEISGVFVAFFDTVRVVLGVVSESTEKWVVVKEAGRKHRKSRRPNVQLINNHRL